MSLNKITKKSTKTLSKVSKIITGSVNKVGNKIVTGFIDTIVGIVNGFTGLNVISVVGTYN